MNFVIAMALRELRASWRRLLFFFLCIGIGTGSIVALRSLIGNVNTAVASEARELLGGDVVIDSTRPWSEETRGEINRAVASDKTIEARTETLEAPTMVRPADESKQAAALVELKGVETNYPLVGEFVIAGGATFTPNILDNNGALVARSLLERLGVSVGDRLRIGTIDFEIRGIVEREPGEGGGGFRVGPRVFVARDKIEETGLTGFGSRARRRILLRGNPRDADALARNLRASISDNLVGIRSYRNAEQNLTDQFRRAEDFLSLTGLIILVLGGLGVANVLRVFIEGKRKTIAVLKCLGASGRQITLAYFTQTVALGAAGALVGVAFAGIALALVKNSFSESLPRNMEYGLRPEAIAQGFALGVLVTVLFALLPLLKVRRIKPRLLLRDEFAGAQEEAIGDDAAGNFLARLRRRKLDFTQLVVGAVVIAGLFAVAAWQAGSIRVGSIFLFSLAVTAGALYLTASLLIRLLNRVRHRGGFPVRQAVGSLHRPGNQTRITVTAVGLGVFLILGIQSLQQNLLREFSFATDSRVPDLFLIDVQADQAEGVAQLIEETTGKHPELVPTVRARIAAVNSQEVDLDAGEIRQERGRLGREYISTYRARLDANERIVAGQFWDATPSADAEVSIDESLRGTGGIDLGSSITFDILGRRITARVTSVRAVDWRNSRTGFIILFRPGVLESAPQTFIGALNGPADETERARFQRRLVDRYPNVSVIDVLNIVRTIEKLLSNITLAVSFLGGFVLLSGVLILIGSIAMTKFQRIYETAMLRTLGAQSRTLLLIIVIEYGLIGLTAGITGSLAAIGLSYAVSRYVFEIDWTATPLINIVGVLATIALVVTIGALASLDVLRRKPLAVLRGA